VEYNPKLLWTTPPTYFIKKGMKRFWPVLEDTAYKNDWRIWGNWLTQVSQKNGH